MRSNLRSFYAAELLLAVGVAAVLVDELDARRSKARQNAGGYERRLECRGLRNRTPSPVPFSSMNLNAAYAKAQSGQ